MLARKAPVLCIAIMWPLLSALRQVPKRSESQASGPCLRKYCLRAGSRQSSTSRWVPNYKVYVYKPVFEGQESTDTDSDIPVYLFAAIKAPYSFALFGFPQKFNYELFSTSNEVSVPTWTGALPCCPPVLRLEWAMPWLHAVAVRAAPPHARVPPRPLRGCPRAR